MCPPSENCIPKKVSDLVPLECAAVLGRQPQNTGIYPVFMGKNRFFADFAIKILIFLFFLVFTLKLAHFATKTFLWSSLSNLRKHSFCASPQNCLCPPPPPPPPVTLLWRRPTQHLHFFEKK